MKHTSKKTGKKKTRVLSTNGFILVFVSSGLIFFIFVNSSLGVLVYNLYSLDICLSFIWPELKDLSKVAIYVAIAIRTRSLIIQVTLSGICDIKQLLRRSMRNIWTPHELIVIKRLTMNYWFRTLAFILASSGQIYPPIGHIVALIVKLGESSLVFWWLLLHSIQIPSEKKWIKSYSNEERRQTTMSSDSPKLAKQLRSRMIGSDWELIAAYH